MPQMSFAQLDKPKPPVYLQNKTQASSHTKCIKKNTNVYWQEVGEFAFSALRSNLFLFCGYLLQLDLHV